MKLYHILYLVKHKKNLKKKSMMMKMRKKKQFFLNVRTLNSSATFFIAEIVNIER